MLEKLAKLGVSSRRPEMAHADRGGFEQGTPPPREIRCLICGSCLEPLDVFGHECRRSCHYSPRTTENEQARGSAGLVQR
jgi:hypothetical protein